jgi:hypothetical protein
VNNILYTSLHGKIFRSLFVIVGTGPADVEVGWTATPSHAAQAYFEFVTSTGSDSGERLGPGVTLNTSPTFKVSAPGPANPNGNYTWTAYLGASSFDSVILGFNTGKLRTNSERHNNCDSMWAEFQSLDNCSTVSGGSCNWHGSYYSLSCYKTVSGGEYRFNKIDNTHHTVPQSGGVTC